MIVLCWGCECTMQQEDMEKDFSIPPMDEDECLCSDCSIESAKYRIEELETEIDMVREQSAKIQQRSKK